MRVSDLVGGQSYKLFIDDERMPVNPDEWIIVRTSDEAMNLVQRKGMPDFISFDHDLGGDDTSMKFVHWMIDAYLDNEIDVQPFEYVVHSQNPIGAQNIKGALTSFFKKIEKDRSNQ